jgi:tetratricopeptide (TPR) repeat protein
MMIAIARLTFCAVLALALGIQAGEQWMVTQLVAQVSTIDQQRAQPVQTAIVAERLYAMSPTAAHAAFARAQVAAHVGEHEVTLEWLARCEGLVVNQARWLRTEAFALYHLGQNAEALAALEKAFALDPTLPDQEVRMLQVLRERAQGV